MYVVRIDNTTPPPLVLAMQTLTGVAPEEGGSNTLPVAVGYGNTYAINDRPWYQAFQSALSPSNIIPLAVTTGQMLWRYLPTLLELDSRKQRRYMSERRLTTNLPYGVEFTSLKRVTSRKQTQTGLARSTMAQIKQQGTLTNDTRHRLRNPNFQIIGDYLTVRDGQNLFEGEKCALTLPKKQFAADVDLNYRLGIAKALDIPLQPDWPGTNDYQTVGDDVYFGDATPAHLLAASVFSRPSMQHDATRCQTHDNPFISDGILSEGVFFDTPLFTAELQAMSDNDFGEVDLSEQPFRIVLNSRMAYPRVRMSLVHELLHILVEMHKFNLSHEAVHELALMIVNDILPSLGALAEYTNKSLQ